MPRFKQITTDESGWSDWISPHPKQPYKMVCCDCGLVHDLEFKAVEQIEPKPNGWWKAKPIEFAYRVLLRARRNEKATAAFRAKDAA